MPSRNLQIEAVTKVLRRGALVLRGDGKVRFHDAPPLPPEDEEEQWVDPTTLPEWDEAAYVEAEAEVANPVPQVAPKLALVRTMRTLQMDGSEITSPGQQTSIWQVVRQALRQAPEEVQEDWDLLTQVNRSDPVMQTFTATLPFPDGVDPEVVMDEVYRRADALDRSSRGGPA